MKGGAEIRRTAPSLPDGPVFVSRLPPSPRQTACPVAAYAGRLQTTVLKTRVGRSAAEGEETRAPAVPRRPDGGTRTNRADAAALACRRADAAASRVPAPVAGVGSAGDVRPPTASGILSGRVRGGLRSARERAASAGAAREAFDRRACVRRHSASRPVPANGCRPRTAAVGRSTACGTLRPVPPP